jgi:hypothetical protein
MLLTADNKSNKDMHDESNGYFKTTASQFGHAQMAVSRDREGRSAAEGFNLPFVVRADRAACESAIDEAVRDAEEKRHGTEYDRNPFGPEIMAEGRDGRATKEGTTTMKCDQCCGHNDGEPTVTFNTDCKLLSASEPDADAQASKTLGGKQEEKRGIEVRQDCGCIVTISDGDSVIDSSGCTMQREIGKFRSAFNIVDDACGDPAWAGTGLEMGR